MLGLVRLAWRNMWRNWRRTAIALVALAVGVLLLVFMDGLFIGSDQAIFGNAVRLYGGNIQVHAPGFRERARRYPLLPLADADAVVRAARARPEVTAAARRINTAGLITGRSGSRPVLVTGLEPAIEAPYSLVAENMVEGRFLLEEDGDAVVVGRHLAEVLGLAVGDRVSLLGRSRGETMRERTMTVVGIYSLGVPDAETLGVYINLPAAQEAYKLPGQATEVVVSLDRVGREPAVMAELERALPGYEIDSWRTLRADIEQAFKTKMGFSSFFGMVVVVIACVGILNILMMAVFERTREMGVLAALGMKGRQIMALFVVEGALIGLVGAGIGYVLGLGLSWWMSRVGFDISYTSGWGEISALMGDRLYTAVTPVEGLGRMATVIVMAAIASLYPAWQASRREPAEVLHHV